jgi:hypothetical protein
MDNSTLHPSGQPEATMIPRWGDGSFDSLTLQYADIAVGDLTEVFVSDATWYGDFRQTLTSPSNAKEQRILEYIAFCKDWDARSYAEADADASEFDQFSDLLSSGLWRTQSPDGTIGEISHAPIFRKEEISWVYLPSKSGEQNA